MNATVDTCIKFQLNKEPVFFGYFAYYNINDTW